MRSPGFVIKADTQLRRKLGLAVFGFSQPGSKLEESFVGDLELVEANWLRGKDLNLRPLGYEPNELPDCSTPHNYTSLEVIESSNRSITNWKSGVHEGDSPCHPGSREP
jgi:hypothetical protein